MGSELEDTLGYRFEDRTLLDDALTHRSVSGPGHVGYDRLEFLGDRVLALVVAEMLYRRFPDEDEGALAKRLVALVRRETLAVVAGDLGLGAHIRMSRGEKEGGGQFNEALLSDVAEAVIAAIYLDGGFVPAESFIERHWRALLEGTAEPPKDPKTTLQEWAQARGLDLPVYRVVERTGPDHAPEFRIEVSVSGCAAQTALGKSKRLAEQDAAAKMLVVVKTDG